MSDWIEPQDVDVPEELKSTVGGHPIITNTLVRRGILDHAAAKAFLDPHFYTPALSLVLPDMEKAVDRLAKLFAFGVILMLMVRRQLHCSLQRFVI
jgi:hypothetical protein